MDLITSAGLTLCATALLCAVMFGLFYCNTPPSFAKITLKTLSTSLLALASVVFGGPLTLTLALALGALGDFMLARGTTRTFLLGLISFALAHLAYAGLTFLIWQGGDLWLVHATLIVFGALMARILYPKTGALRWPVMIYIAIIMVMGMAAFGTQRPVLIVAALLFMLSDALLSGSLFVLNKDAKWQRFAPYAVWSTYWTAQFLFLYGFLTL